MYPKHTPLTLGIHLTWAMLGVGLTAAWADEPVILRTQAKPSQAVNHTDTAVAPNTTLGTNALNQDMFVTANAIARKPAPPPHPKVIAQDGVRDGLQSHQPTLDGLALASPPSTSQASSDSTSNHSAPNNLASSNEAQDSSALSGLSLSTATPNAHQPTNNTTTTIARKPSTLTPNTEHGNNLTHLTSFYRPATHSHCQGTWHYPYVSSSTDNALNVRANYGYYNADDLAELSGDVVVSQNGQQIFANRLTLNPKTGDSQAIGNVIFGRASNPLINPADDRPSNNLMGLASRLSYNPRTGQMHAQEVAFASSNPHAHGYAKALTRPNDTSYQLEGALFSTCPPDNRVWHINADSINIDHQTGRGVAKHTTLTIKNVPVFYLPYFNFPIDDRRSSGFLTPSIGLNSEDGLQLSAPYYLNLAPNYDATLTPTLYSNRNPKIAGEFRYLMSDYGTGTLEAAYLPSDRQYNHQHRHHVFFDHQWQSKKTNNLKLSATYRHVSDSGYLSDFNELGLTSNPLNLPRRLSSDYQNDYLNAKLHAETFQNLAGTDSLGNPILDKDRPYARLPQLLLQYTIPNRVTNLSVSGISNGAYFKKAINDGSEAEKSGLRLYNQLSASYPIIRSWGYVTPKLNLSHLYLFYDEDSLIDQKLNKKDRDRSLFAPSFVLDTGVHLQKAGAPFGWLEKGKGGYQLLSPRLKYLYTPHINQSDIPNFETTQASISYDQLLADDWFLGHDRINDLHAITPALNYRYIDEQGKTRLDANIAEQFYLRRPQVGLTNQTPKSAHSSGLAWRFMAQPYEHLWFDLSGSFKPSYDPNALVATVRYQPYANALLSASLIERKSNPALGQLPLSAYSVSLVYPLSPKWQLMTSAQYDNQAHKFMDTLVGVNYEDCCIGFSIYGRQYRNDLRPNDDINRAVMAEVRLNGLTSKGKFARLLQERIIGYTPRSD